MDDLEAIRAEIEKLKVANGNRLKDCGSLRKAVEALQRENYSLKARVAELEQQTYLMNYKPKQQ